MNNKYKEYEKYYHWVKEKLSSKEAMEFDLLVIGINPNEYTYYKCNKWLEEELENEKK